MFGRSGARTDTDPEARNGPRAQAPHSALGLEARREARFFVSGAGFGPQGWATTRNVQAGLYRGLQPDLRRPLFPRPSFRGEGADCTLGAPRGGHGWSRSAGPGSI